jgi:hypothetical protein
MSVAVYSLFGSSTVITCTLNGLANSAAGVGRQSAQVVNTSSNEGAQLVRVFFQITTGTSPTANTPVTFYLLQYDGPTGSINVATDGAAGSDAGITIVTASIVGVLTIPSTASNTAYSGSFLIRNPGPYWGLAVVNNSGVALAGSGQVLRYIIENVSTP